MSEGESNELSLSESPQPEETVPDEGKLILDFVQRAGEFSNGIAFTFADPQYKEHTERHGVRSKDYKRDRDGEKNIWMWVIDPKRDEELRAAVQRSDSEWIKTRFLTTFIHGIGLRGRFVRIFPPPRIFFPLVIPDDPSGHLPVLTAKGRVFPSSIQTVSAEAGDSHEAFANKIFQKIITPGFCDNFPKLSLQRGLVH